jgi:hypothetical protein
VFGLRVKGERGAGEEAIGLVLAIIAVVLSKEEWSGRRIEPTCAISRPPCVSEGVLAPRQAMLAPRAIATQDAFREMRHLLKNGGGALRGRGDFARVDRGRFCVTQAIDPVIGKITFSSKIPPAPAWQRRRF